MNNNLQNKFSKTKIDKAGVVLCNKNNKYSQEDQIKALEILSYWRAMHSYPMHVFKNRLRIVSEKIDKNALSAQRLKRVPSIIKKLKRQYEGKEATMKLTQMQDIAGCRAIMSNVNLVKKLYKDYYLNGDLKHKKVNYKDYITNPKKDGYRSLHLIYRYKSDKGKKKYNGLLVEVQIRSKLQHVWATAVETVGFFTGQAIKSNEGEKKWEYFFRLVSSKFAKFENCPHVPGTPSDEKELNRLINKMATDLKVEQRLTGWMDSLKEFENLKSKTNAYYFLLELDTIQEKLVITSYSKRNEKKAIDDYVKAEKRIYGKPDYDVVLVGADSLFDLKKAYPNYFLNTKQFLINLNKIIKKY